MSRPIAPERLEVFAQQHAAHRLQVEADEVPEAAPVRRRPVAAAPQQQPARLSQPRRATPLLQLADLRAPDGVDCRVHVERDVEPVEHVEGVVSLLGDDLEVRLPHVAADEPQRLRPLPAEPPEEPQERLDAPRLADPQEPRVRGVDLVDQGEIPMPVLPLDLVDAHGFNPRQILVRPAPGDGHGHRAEHAVPGGVKGRRHLAPTQPLRPPRQEPRVGGRQLVFSLRPRHPLDAHTAAPRAGDPAHPIQEEDAEAPERHELEPPRGERVVLGAAAPAPRAARLVAPVRVDFHLEPEGGPLLAQSDRPIHESAMFLNPIQDSLDLHPAFASEHRGLVLQPPLSQGRSGMRCSWRWAPWKLPAPWTHRPRPPRRGKRCAFSTSFHRASSLPSHPPIGSITHRFC